MTAARNRGRSELVDDPLECGDDRGDRGVADDVEARCDAGLGAGAEVGSYRVNVETDLLAKHVEKLLGGPR